MKRHEENPDSSPICSFAKVCSDNAKSTDAPTKTTSASKPRHSACTAKPESKTNDWDKWFSCISEEELLAKQEKSRLSKRTIAVAKHSTNYCPGCGVFTRSCLVAAMELHKNPGKNKLIHEKAHGVIPNIG